MNKKYNPARVISLVMFVASIYAAFYLHAVPAGILIFLLGIAVPAGDKYMRN